MNNRRSVTGRPERRTKNITASAIVALLLPLLALAFTAATPSSAEAAGRDCGSSRSPRSGQVMLFQHRGYGGRCEVFSQPDINLTDNLIGNDTASSIKVGAGIGVRLCQNKNYSGSCTIFTGNARALADYGIGNDRASSLAFGQRCTSSAPGRGHVFLYQHANYGGFCMVFSSSAPDFTFIAIGLTASSIKVGTGISAVLCSGAHFRGTCEHFSRNDSSLKNNAVGNDRARSIKLIHG